MTGKSTETKVYLSGREYSIQCDEGFDAPNDGLIWMCINVQWDVGRTCVPGKINTSGKILPLFLRCVLFYSLFFLRADWQLESLKESLIVSVFIYLFHELKYSSSILYFITIFKQHYYSKVSIHCRAAKLVNSNILVLYYLLLY